MRLLRKSRLSFLRSLAASLFCVSRKTRLWLSRSVDALARVPVGRFCLHGYDVACIVLPDLYLRRALLQHSFPQLTCGPNDHCRCHSSCDSVCQRKRTDYDLSINHRHSRCRIPDGTSSIASTDIHQRSRYHLDRRQCYSHVSDNVRAVSKVCRSLRYQRKRGRLCPADNRHDNPTSIIHRRGVTHLSGRKSDGGHATALFAARIFGRSRNGIGAVQWRSPDWMRTVDRDACHLQQSHHFFNACRFEQLYHRQVHKAFRRTTVNGLSTAVGDSDAAERQWHSAQRTERKWHWKFSFQWNVGDDVGGTGKLCFHFHFQGYHSHGIQYGHCQSHNGLRHQRSKQQLRVTEQEEWANTAADRSLEIPSSLP